VAAVKPWGRVTVPVQPEQVRLAPQLGLRPQVMHSTSQSPQRLRREMLVVVSSVSFSHKEHSPVQGPHSLAAPGKTVEWRQAPCAGCARTDLLLILAHDVTRGNHYSSDRPPFLLCKWRVGKQAGPRASCDYCMGDCAVTPLCASPEETQP
jgi:hypothetical protein